MVLVGSSSGSSNNKCRICHVRYDTGGNSDNVNIHMMMKSRSFICHYSNICTSNAAGDRCNENILFLPLQFLPNGLAMMIEVFSKYFESGYIGKKVGS